MGKDKKSNSDNFCVVCGRPTDDRKIWADAWTNQFFSCIVCKKVWCVTCMGAITKKGPRKTWKLGIKKAITCPDCSTSIPMLRLPKNLPFKQKRSVVKSSVIPQFESDTTMAPNSDEEKILNKFKIENADFSKKEVIIEKEMGGINPPFEAYFGDDPYIFISYPHKNMAEVYPIINRLYGKGFNIWYDEGISLGSDFRDILAEKVANCSLFLSFISPHVLESKDTVTEIKFADGEGKPFIIIYLTKIESIDFSKDYGLKFRIKGKQGLIKPLIPEDLFYKKLENEIKLLMNK